MKPVDVAGAAIYAVELGLWLGIMILGVVYNLRNWLRRSKTAAENSQEVIEMEEPQIIAEAAAVPISGLSETAVSVSSHSASVFNTVGLRKRALQMLNLRRRNVEA